MNTEFRRDQRKNYLVVETEEETAKAYDLSMAEKNTIPGFVPLEVRRQDGKPLFYYDITSLQSLQSFGEHLRIDAPELRDLLSQILEISARASAFLLDPQRLLFAPQYLFRDPQKGEWKMCYLPGSLSLPELEPKVLAEFLLPKLNHADLAAVQIGYDFYQQSCSPNFHLSKMGEKLAGQDAQPDGSGYAGATGLMNSGLWGDQMRRYARNERTDRTDGRGRTDGPDRTDEPDRTNGIDRIDGRDRTNGIDRANGTDAKFGDEGNRKHRWKETSQVRRNAKDYGFLVPLCALVLLLVASVAAAAWGVLTWARSGELCFVLIAGAFLARKAQKALEEWKRVRKKGNQGKWVESDEAQVALRKQAQERKEELRRELYQEDRTILLSEENSRSGMVLVSVLGPWPEIMLGTASVLVGKAKNQTDLCLAEPTVSRIHAKLSCKHRRYYVTDQNSRNGTYVNGTLLPPFQEHEVQEGDEICFGTVAYHVVYRGEERTVLLSEPDTGF